MGDIRTILITTRQDNLDKVVILNTKGGCGKSTLATNLAAYYAKRGLVPSIMDHDPQGSSMAWLDRRSPDLPKIHGIAASKRPMHKRLETGSLKHQIKLKYCSSTLLPASTMTIFAN